LVTIQSWHEDVTKNQIGLVVIDFGERIEAVFCEEHFITALLEKYLCTATHRVAVIHYQHLPDRILRFHEAISLVYLNWRTGEARIR